MAVAETKEVILYNAQGVPHAVSNGTAVPINTPSLLVAGRDGAGVARDLPVERIGDTPGDTGVCIAGSTGGALPTVQRTFVRANGALRVENIDYLWNIQEGHVPGHAVFNREIQIPVVADIAIPPPALFVLGLWNEQITPAQWSVVSTSAADAVAGTGATHVQLEFIDGAGARVTETIALAGLTPVNIVSLTALKLDVARVVGVGAGVTGANVGTISVMSAPAGGGVAVGQILVGNNKMYSGVFYAGANETVQVASVAVGTSNKDIVFSAKHYQDHTAIGGTVVGTFEHFDSSGRGATSRNLPIPRKLKPNEKLEFYAAANTPGDTGYLSISGWRE